MKGGRSRVHSPLGECYRILVGAVLGVQLNGSFHQATRQARRLTNNLNRQLSYPACLDQPLVLGGSHWDYNWIIQGHRAEAKTNLIGQHCPTPTRLQATSEMLNNCSTNIGILVTIISLVPLYSKMSERDGPNHWLGYHVLQESPRVPRVPSFTLYELI